MLEIERPKIECAEMSEDKRYAKFVMEPLERGFGTTLGIRSDVSCSHACPALP